MSPMLAGGPSDGVRSIASPRETLECCIGLLEPGGCIG